MSNDKKLLSLEKYTDYEAVIGSEVHIQLKTNTKIFCDCKNEQCDIPNTNICPVCCGYPGTLPVFNEKVMEFAIMAGLATNCTINKNNYFARKHYFYPDLPKGYQITQSDQPICVDGFIEIKDEQGNPKKIRIQRIHMEEDAGKNIHSDKYGSLVDYNRAGTPLLELVTYPDMSSQHDVRAYLKELHSILVSTGITTGNMDEGSFRSDTNISVRKKGDTKLGTKCELKNINSFKFIHDATDYEIGRQIDLIESGEKVIQQTRLWDTKSHETFMMRTKEGADDYRYFADPDLPLLVIEDTLIENIRNKMPKLPRQIKNDLIAKYQLSEYEVEILYDNSDLLWFFEETYSKIKSKLVISWVLRELVAAIKEFKVEVKNYIFTPNHLFDLLSLLNENKISQKIAKDIFDICFASGENVLEYANKNNLISVPLNNDEIKNIVIEFINENKANIDEYKSGKIKLRGFIIGELMKKTKGKANPSLINTIFDELTK